MTLLCKDISLRISNHLSWDNMMITHAKRCSPNIAWGHGWCLFYRSHSRLSTSLGSLREFTSTSTVIESFIQIFEVFPHLLRFWVTSSGLFFYKDGFIFYWLVFRRHISKWNRGILLFVIDLFLIASDINHFSKIYLLTFVVLHGALYIWAALTSGWESILFWLMSIFGLILLDNAIFLARL